jgi:hypothetical protein
VEGTEDDGLLEEVLESGGDREFSDETELAE